MLSCTQPPVSPPEAACLCAQTPGRLVLGGSQASSRALWLSVFLRVRTLSNATPQQSKA